MAWTTPLTFTTGSLPASTLNQQIRDNLLETLPGRATDSGGFFVRDSSGHMSQRRPVIARDSTFGTTSSNPSYSALDSPVAAGPTVTVTTGTAALVIYGGRMGNYTANAQSSMVYSLNGDDAATVRHALAFLVDGVSGNNPWGGCGWDVNTTLTPGSNTFELQYRTGGAGVGIFGNRVLIVWPLN